MQLQDCIECKENFLKYSKKHENLAMRLAFKINGSVCSKKPSPFAPS